MDRYRYTTRKQNPSFSSTLLDVIYQSVDDTQPGNNGCFSQVDNSLRRSSGGSKNFVLAPGFEYSSSSSEAERMYGFPASLRPLRTRLNEDDELNTRQVNKSIMYHDQKQQQQHEEYLQPMANCEVKFVKPKSRAMRIYSYLKKGTHPVSPGGRLTRFLISLFSTTNAKKSPPCTGGDHDATIAHADRKFNVSTPSSASSFSRSCLNQTTSSVKRNAMFYPSSVNVIDEYSHKSLDRDRSDSVKYATSSINREVNMNVSGKNRHIEETTMNLLMNYRKEAEYVFDSIRNNDRNKEDDETASYASSDLFELDHLSTIGIDDRCMQELPLYETTSVDANRAIANGLRP